MEAAEPCLASLCGNLGTAAPQQGFVAGHISSPLSCMQPSETMARQSLCPTLHKRACNSKLMNKIMNSYEFMTKVQVLKALGSILARKWQLDTFQKARLKVLKHVTESQILGLFFFLYHSCFGLGESCPTPILDVRSISLNPFKTDHLALTFPMK